MRSVSLLLFGSMTRKLVESQDLIPVSRTGSDLRSRDQLKWR